jgi:hypothetical protein
LIKRKKEKEKTKKKRKKKLFYLNSDIKPSGFYSYDVQWEPIDKGFYL